MSATFSVDLDAEVLRLAEEEARARQTSLSEMVSGYLSVLAKNRRESAAGKTPGSDSLRGAVKLPESFVARDVVEETLMRKYGEG